MQEQDSVIPYAGGYVRELAWRPGVVHALLEIGLWKFLLQEVENLFRQRSSTGRESAYARQVVFLDEWVANKPNENWWNEQQFSKLIFYDGIKQVLHCESRKYVYFSIDEDGEVKSVNQAGDW